MIDLQSYIDAVVGKDNRDEYMAAGGLVLIQVIQILDAAEEDGRDMATPVRGLVSPHSYRGYYERLAFEEGRTTLGDMRELARSCIGQTFGGYKGGEFTMGPGSMVHVAEYGCTGGDNSELTYPKLRAIIAQADMT